MVRPIREGRRTPGCRRRRAEKRRNNSREHDLSHATISLFGVKIGNYWRRFFFSPYLFGEFANNKFGEENIGNSWRKYREPLREKKYNSMILVPNAAYE